MDVNNEIRLRLRFYKDVDDSIENVQQKFETYSKKELTDFAINVHENHIWFYVIGTKKRFWSPHLHLQLEPKTEKTTHIRGLFGPDQTLWTFFMFLHFIVAGVFTIYAMFAYSNYTLKLPVLMDVMVMIAMVIVWFLLYFIARQIRKKGNGQMNEMEHLFLEILESRVQ